MASGGTTRKNQPANDREKRLDYAVLRTGAGGQAVFTLMGRLCGVLARRLLVLGVILGWLLVGRGVGTVCAQVLAAPAETPIRSTMSEEEYFFESPPMAVDQWNWQILPDGLMYPAYLASGRESRIASHWMREGSGDSFWDIALGGRVGMLRYGNRDPLLPDGLQIDIEGAAFPRLTLDSQRDLVAVDFRFGVPITARLGKFETKLAYYHLSSHLGDEYWEKNRNEQRINYARDVIVLGVAVRPHDDLRLYAEAGWAGYVSGGSEPWEFQFGVDYSPLRPTSIGGAPFFAVNGRIRQEVDFGGNVTAQTGWQWRGETGRLFRFGFHYLNGQTDVYQFFSKHEEQLAIGLWYDY